MDAANTLETGRPQGGQLGSLSFVSAAACFNGVKFDGFVVAHKRCGLYQNARPARRTEALGYMTSFKSSLHLLASVSGSLSRTLDRHRSPNVFGVGGQLSAQLSGAASIRARGPHADPKLLRRRSSHGGRASIYPMIFGTPVPRIFPGIIAGARSYRALV